ncbi:hypothetical protein APHAL10511_004642 [Amanita phalloides]|nr:hypothetical protein APHAL10511_004642 [Amanita phalloides]
MPGSPIRVGFVGLSTRGWASTTHGPALLSLSDKYTLTAVSTSSPESASETAAKFTESTGHPVKAYHGSSESIANDPDVDLVAVSVKAPMHKDAALPAIAAGKNLFLEWPAGVRLGETVELAEAGRKQGVKTFVGLQDRQSRAFKKVQELLTEIGPVRSTTTIITGAREVMAWGPIVHESNTWVLDPKSGSSAATIYLGHLLDAFTQALGDFEYVNTTAEVLYPVSKVVRGNATEGVEDSGRTIQSTLPDHVAVTGKLKSGAVASIILRVGLKTTEGRRQFLWEIDGEEGSIRVEGPNFMTFGDCNVYLNGKLVQELQEGSVMVKGVTAAWIEFAKGEEGDYPTLDDAVKVRHLIESIERSAIEGRRVHI